MRSIFENRTNAKPFIKWVGGKSQLLDNIRGMYPKKDSINRYCEPFVGGGAVLFDIIEKYDFSDILINDVNFDLINAYKTVQCDPETIIEVLSEIQNRFYQFDNIDRKRYYYEMRDKFNALKITRKDGINIEKAALFIFLNKTCFNGLYRVNAKGFFNVPMGDYKNPLICDSTNIRNVAKSLKKVTINCGDFSECKRFVDHKTFVYIDPPYRPISKTACFTAYSENAFSDVEQIRLGKFINEINDTGASVVLSNSDPKNSNPDDNFFDELYRDYNVMRVSAKRMINSDSSKRGNIFELLITNCYQ